MNINISLWNTIKICSGIAITKIIWDTSTVLKKYLIDEENLYRISRSIEKGDPTELPDDEHMEELKEYCMKKRNERNNTTLNKIGF